MSSPDKPSRRIKYDGLAHDTILLSKDASHKVLRVLRLQIGDRFSVVDDSGTAYSCHVASISGDQVTAVVNDRLADLHKCLPINVAIAVIKGKRMDWAVEKLAELGAQSIIPVITDRSVVSAAGTGKTSRWEKIAESAALQSGHSHPARITAVRSGIDSIIEDDGAKWFLDLSANYSDNTECDVHSTFPWTLLVGPEGGWSQRELELLRVSTSPLSLGASVLRTETAAISGLFMLKNIFQIISNK